MQTVQIRIPDKEASAKAMVEMARRERVDCYPDDIYIVPEAALQLLHNLGIHFLELGRGGLDHSEKTLRDSLAAHQQRQPAGKPGEVLSDAQ